LWDITGSRQYIVSPDGRRFLVDNVKEVTSPVSVISNWKPKAHF
jgi:hypothetical protein